MMVYYLRVFDSHKQLLREEGDVGVDKALPEVIGQRVQSAALKDVLKQCVRISTELPYMAVPVFEGSTAVIK